MRKALSLILPTLVGVSLLADQGAAPVVSPATFPGATQAGARSTHRAAPAVPRSAASSDLTDVVEQYCVRCHSDRRLTGGLSLEQFDVGSVTDHAEIGEKMIVKLRAGMMPPPGARRPEGDTLVTLVEEIEHKLDSAFLAAPAPGGRTFQRLNRAEYEASVADLLDLDIDAGDFLPLDTKSANFDNIADVQLLSPTVLDAYLRAADEISRLAVGMPNPSPTSVTYSNTGYVSQWERMPGAPLGTRGGISAVHNFPATGEYRLRLWFEHTTMGEMFGRVTPGEQIDVSIDGRRVDLIDVDRWLSTSDPNSASMETVPIQIESGPHRVTAAFIKLSDGPVEDLTSPHDWSLVDRQVGVNGYGITALAHIKDLVILGPYDPSDVADTPSRRAIFECYPERPEDERPCAESIVERLSTRAFRRPVTESALESLMGLYDQGAERGGFEEGVRTALQGILAMPDFVFRIEEAPSDIPESGIYRITDLDLATRLAFFLWGAPPDDSLIAVAAAGRLGEDDVLESEVRRMLRDPRSSALSTRFASQWLRLEDLEKVHPDRLLYPDFHEGIANDMLQETELFFSSLVKEDRSVLELFNADYTFLNERLAEHYGIRGVIGPEFRKVSYPDDRRAGILGHGSVLTLTSHANRTSPVLRGKWIMEVLMGTPPPPPPPNVPALEETEGAEEGRMLTTRERMEIHRANPSCASCHNLIDPIGLALDNFDVTGAWRIRENGVPLDTRGDFYDGTTITSPAELRAVLMSRPTPLLRNFTSNLMAYALGRRIEYTDGPRVRQVVRAAEADGHRFSAYVLAIVESDAFRMQQVPETLSGIQH